MQKLLLALSSAAWAALCVIGCTSASPNDGTDPPPTGKLDLDIHRTGAPVTGSSFACTGTWPSSLTPCGYAWTSQPVTSEFSDSGVVHLTLHRSPIPVDGGASTVFIDLQSNPAVVGAKAWESTSRAGTAQQVETSRPLSGWIDPFVTGVSPGARNAGQFSLTFAWGSIKGTYDTSP